MLGSIPRTRWDYWGKWDPFFLIAISHNVQTVLERDFSMKTKKKKNLEVWQRVFVVALLTSQNWYFTHTIALGITNFFYNCWGIEQVRLSFFFLNKLLVFSSFTEGTCLAAKIRVYWENTSQADWKVAKDRALNAGQECGQRYRSNESLLDLLPSTRFKCP